MLGPGSAVSLMAIDFHKAFNRMDHSACVETLRNMGATPHSVALVNAFLFRRSMRIKIGDTLSQKRRMPGGAPQGSILACFLFCATINPLLELSPQGDVSGSSDQSEEQLSTTPNSSYHTANDEEDNLSSGDDNPRFFRFRANPLDDTVESVDPSQEDLDRCQGVPDNWKEKPPILAGYIDDVTVIEKVRESDAPTHITRGKTKKKIHAPESETILGEVGTKADEVGMVINPTKTQMLCISSSGNDANTYIRHGGEVIRSQEEMKILGFWFDRRPDVSCHVRKMLSKARIRLWSLRELKKAGLKENDLLNSYKCMVRPVLDYTAPSYHSQLTGEQSNDIERYQASAMKVVYGNTVSYRTVLEHEKIEKHSTRRKLLVEKFATKASEHDLFKTKWFPLNTNVGYNLRDPNVYLEERARTTRLQKSPIFFMRKILNEMS